MTPLVSVIIPAFNEAGRIGATMARVCEYLSRQSYAWEVVVIIDGGSPAAALEARQTAAVWPNVTVLENGINRGKGYSVRRGFAGAGGALLVFIDADLSLPIEGIAPMLAQFEAGADVVIGSRLAPGARVEGTPPRLRGLMGRVFNGVVQVVALPGLADTQCGFKGFRAEAATRIFAAQRIDRFGFDVEALYLARRFGYRIDEIPVVCTYHGGSSVNRIGDVLSMVRDLLLVRWWHR